MYTINNKALFLAVHCCLGIRHVTLNMQLHIILSCLEWRYTWNKYTNFGFGFDRWPSHWFVYINSWFHWVYMLSAMEFCLWQKLRLHCCPTASPVTDSTSFCCRHLLDIAAGFGFYMCRLFILCFHIYIQGAPRGKFNILGGHSIDHSKQKSVCVHFWTVSEMELWMLSPA
jgi:hypothetical protein